MYDQNLTMHILDLIHKSAQIIMNRFESVHSVWIPSLHFSLLFLGYGKKCGSVPHFMRVPVNRRSLCHQSKASNLSRLAQERKPRHDQNWTIS